MTCVANDTFCKPAGDTTDYDVQYVESDGVTPIDLTGAVAKMSLKDAATDTVVVEDMSGGITDAEQGMMRFSLTKTETAALLPRPEASRALAYSVRITYADTTSETILTGTFTLEQVATDE